MGFLNKDELAQPPTFIMKNKVDFICIANMGVQSVLHV